MSDTIKNLENLISLTSVRQKVIARNISNINTEYYKREEVSFDECMNEGMNTAMKSTSGLHLGGSPTGETKDINITVKKDETMTYNSGINNVNIDKEMSDMAENQIMFKFASRKINSYFKTMQEVIKGGR